LRYYYDDSKFYILCCYNVEAEINANSDRLLINPHWRIAVSYDASNHCKLSADACRNGDGSNMVFQMKLIKKIELALREADSDSEGYPDYEELARVALRAVAKKLRKMAK
jgi:hypothetical protein